VYVDALGNTSTYEAYLSSTFPGINFTVTTKADSKFKIVGAASVAAKVTRDACIEGWCFEELDGEHQNGDPKGFGREFGSGYPSGTLEILSLQVRLVNSFPLQIPEPKLG
jgi:ribonuclease H2 subunit A